MARPRRQKPKNLSITVLLSMGFGSMAVLGGLVWLALAYNHAALLAVLLPVLPVIFSFFIEQCRGTLEEWREENGNDDDMPELSHPTRNPC